MLVGSLVKRKKSGIRAGWGGNHDRAVSLQPPLLLF